MKTKLVLISALWSTTMTFSCLSAPTLSHAQEPGYRSLAQAASTGAVKFWYSIATPEDARLKRKAKIVSVQPGSDGHPFAPGLKRWSFCTATPNAEARRIFLECRSIDGKAVVSTSANCGGINKDLPGDIQGFNLTDASDKSEEQTAHITVLCEKDGGKGWPATK